MLIHDDTTQRMVGDVSQYCQIAGTLTEDMAARRYSNIETIRHIVSWRTLGQAKPGGTPRPPIPQPPAK